MNSSELHRLLCQGPPPSRMAETKQKCAAILQEKAGTAKNWILDIPLAGMAIYRCAHVGGSGDDLYPVFPGSSRPRRPHILAAAVGGHFLWRRVCRFCFAGQRYDMDELEASTCVSRTELALAKLILAAAADLVILTSALVLGRAQTGKALLALFFYLLVPFLFCAVTTLTVPAALPAEQWNTLYCDMFHHSCGAADGTPYSTAAV